MASVTVPAHGPVAEPPYTFEVAFLGASSAAAATGIPGVEQTGPGGWANQEVLYDG